MDKTPFGDLARFLARSRVSRLEAMKALCGGAVVALAGGVLARGEGHAKKRGRRSGNARAASRKDPVRAATSCAPADCAPDQMLDPETCACASTGCGIGFWKNHTLVWPEPYAPTGPIADVLYSAGGNSADVTFLDGLRFKGGRSLGDAQRILQRVAIAAILNEAAFGDRYCGGICGDGGECCDDDRALIDAVNATMYRSRAEILTLAARLDAANSGVCPLGGPGDH